MVSETIKERDRETRRETKRDRETHTERESGWQIPCPSSSFRYLLNDTG